MAKVSEVKKKISEVEYDIVHNRNSINNNSRTAYYYSLLGLYRFLGGKETIAKRVIKSGVLNHLPNERAKGIYTEQAFQYSHIAQAYFKFKRIEKRYTVKNIDSTLLYDEVSRLFFKEFPSYTLDYIQINEDIDIVVKKLLCEVANSQWDLRVNINDIFFKTLDKVASTIDYE